MLGISLSQWNTCFFLFTEAYIWSLNVFGDGETLCKDFKVPLITVFWEGGAAIYLLAKTPSKAAVMPCHGGLCDWSEDVLDSPPANCSINRKSEETCWRELAAELFPQTVDRPYEGQRRQAEIRDHWGKIRVCLLYTIVVFTHFRVQLSQAFLTTVL